MPVEGFVEQAVVVLGAATLVALVCARLRLPTVVGLLVAGALVGPPGLGLVADRQSVEIFAEIGVVFLLFGIGLEFSLERIREIRRAFLFGGAIQSVLTVALVAALARAAGLPPRNATFLGLVAALSSTAIVLKLYADRRELETPQGKLLIGILLFQDVLLVPIMLLLPVLGGAAGVTAGAVAVRFALGAVAIAGIFALARFGMPRVLAAIARTGVREVLVLGAVALCLAAALATSLLGFSLALGAFIAGLVLAESEYSHQVIAETSPLRDLFNSVFFVSVGMLLDPAVLRDSAALVAAATAAILVLKTLAGSAAVAALRYPARIAGVVGLSLAQTGEFSFVVLEVGRRFGLVAPALHGVILAAAVLSMLLAPALVVLARRLPGVPAKAPAPSGPTRHVVVVGFGVAGRNLAHVLRATGIGYVVVELDPKVAAAARAEGEPVLFGDATRREILHAAGVENAEVVVFVISDREALQRSLRFVRELAPRLRIVVRTRRVADIEPLLAAGADEVIAEEFETSIEIFTRVLAHYHVPANVVRAQTRLLRGESYRMLRLPPGATVPAAVLDLLAAGTTELYRVEPNGASVGHTLGDLDLRRRSRATVIAIVRDSGPLPNPAPDTALAAGDTLVLVGGHADIDRAVRVLDGEAADT